MITNIEQYNGDTVTIQFKNGWYRLLINNEPWMLEHSTLNIAAKQFFGCNYISSGKVLTSGLGFGILPYMLCENKAVESVTVIERSQELINYFLSKNILPDKLKIINADINNFKTDEYFDTVVLDHYEMESYEEQINNLKKVFNQIPNHSIFYCWRIEEIFLHKILNSDRNNLDKHNWNELKNYIGIPTLPDLDKNTLNLIFNKYFLS